jgi:hypothetical protein
MSSHDEHDSVDSDARVHQSARATQGGEVNQLGRGTQINGLSGRAAVAIVAAVTSLALGAFLTFAMLTRYGNSNSQPSIGAASAGADRPGPSNGAASGPVAGSANGVKVVLSAHDEGGLFASRYLPTADEERDYLFSKFGEADKKPGYVAFGDRQHLVPIDQYWYKLTIINVGGTAIRVVDIKPVVLQRQAPINEVLYYPCCGAGGEDAVRATLNLDDPHPSLMQGATSYFEGHSVPIGPGDSFDITVDTKVQKYDCSYLLDVQYIDSSGNLLDLKVTNPGFPSSASFELTASAIGGTYRRVYTPKLSDPNSSWRDGNYVRSDNQKLAG